MADKRSVLELMQDDIFDENKIEEGGGYFIYVKHRAQRYTREKSQSRRNGGI